MWKAHRCIRFWKNESVSAGLPKMHGGVFILRNYRKRFTSRTDIVHRQKYTTLSCKNTYDPNQCQETLANTPKRYTQNTQPQQFQKLTIIQIHHKLQKALVQETRPPHNIILVHTGFSNPSHPIAHVDRVPDVSLAV